MEMLVSVAIMAVLLGFAVPAYQRYVTTAQEGVLRNNIQSMHIFQEDYFLRTGRYANNLADLAAIEAAIGWRPPKSRRDHLCCGPAAAALFMM